MENRKIEITGINRILCKVAGSDLNILSQCPHEISRHSRIGAIVITTALLAAVSMFFAIQTVSQSTSIGLVAGAVWGLVIFILDSYIVASYKKNDDKWKEFKVASPRLFLALVLGCSISIPLELKVFENEIDQEIKKLISESDIANSNLETEKYLKAIEPYNKEKLTLQKDNNDLNGKIEPFSNKVSKLENDLADEMGSKGRTGKLGYGPVAQAIDQQLQLARIEKKRKEDEFSPKIQQNNARIIVLDSLIASVKKEPIPKTELYGISAQLDGLKRLTSKNDFVLFAYWIFFLLILGLETAPIFVKLFTPKGSYDEIFEMNEYITFIEQQKRKSDLHEMINSELSAIRSINAEKKIAQDTVNQRLMIEIAAAQGEIAEKAIQLWKDRQLAKVNNNLDVFIRSNEPLTNHHSNNHDSSNVNILENGLAIQEN